MAVAAPAGREAASPPPPWQVQRLRSGSQSTLTSLLSDCAGASVSAASDTIRSLNLTLVPGSIWIAQCQCASASCKPNPN